MNRNTSTWPGALPAVASASHEERLGAILAHLNPQQRQAVQHGEGPLLILAGAGSGKTRVITRRIAWLVENGVHPAEILAITFTNKAANEMKDRLRSLLGSIAERMWVGTFHSMFLRILRQHAEVLGFTERFTILDTDDQKKVLKDCFKTLHLNESLYPLRTAQNQISAAKNELHWPQDYAAEQGRTPQQKIFPALYAEVMRTTRAQNAMDFDDILLYAVKLLESQAEVLRYYRQRFRYILVDEYQDTNHAQYRLVQLLSGKHGNLAVVGDDDQSIYAFRGANLQNILSFEEDFRPCTVIKLEQNYRSTGTILAAANAVIAKNVDRKGKKLWTENPGGERIRFYRASDHYDEARYVAREIRRIMAAQTSSGSAEPPSIGILYRVNALSRNLEFALREEGIAYEMYGGLRFYDRKEIRDVLAYLRLLEEPADRLAFGRVINTPRRGIGAVTVERVLKLATESGQNPLQICARAGSYEGLRHAAERLRGFAALCSELRQILEENQLDFARFIQLLEEKSGLEDELEAAKLRGDQDAETRLENLRELRSDAQEFAAREREDLRLLAEMQERYGDNPYVGDILPEAPAVDGTSPLSLEQLLRSFLENAALYSNQDRREENAPAVTMMTIHSAKGLEFDNCFLVGAEKGIFPGYQVLSDLREMEEERRLAYVAITRARRQLVITATRSRLLYGKTQCYPVSPFIEDIPDELVEEIGGSRHGDGEWSRRYADADDWDDSASGYGGACRYRSTLRSDSSCRSFSGESGRRTGSCGAQPDTGLSARQEAPLLSSGPSRIAAQVAALQAETPAVTGNDATVLQRLSQLAPGSRVRHARFGVGIVENVEATLGDAILTIRFGDQVKHMMAATVKLTVEENG